MADWTFSSMPCITCGFMTMFRDINGNPECAPCNDKAYIESINRERAVKITYPNRGLSYSPKTKNIARNLMGKPIK